MHHVSESKTIKENDRVHSDRSAFTHPRQSVAMTVNPMMPRNRNEVLSLQSATLCFCMIMRTEALDINSRGVFSCRR